MCDGAVTVSHDFDAAAEANSDYSSDEEDKLLEPRFKYQRIEGPDAKQMLTSQIISTMAAHLKLIVVGTQMGYLWIMDHFGHVDHEHIPVLRPHRSAVTKLSIDEQGNYVMSCGNDGRVAVSGIGCDNLNHVVSLSVMPRSIAISPLFSKPTLFPMFVVGERNLTIYEKKFFSYKETVIFRGGEKDGFISQCSWQQSLIALTNDGGTRIFDKVTDQLISLIPPSHDVDRARSSHFPPTHCWLDDVLLAVAWADTLTIVKVTASEGSPRRRAEIHFMWHLNMFCSGVSYMNGTSGERPDIVIFGLKLDCDDADTLCETTPVVSYESIATTTSPVQLSLLAPKTYSTYRLLAEDQLSLSAKNCSQPWQFSMAGLPSCESYFLASASDLVIATPYCAKDTVRWRVENGLLEEAWELACEKQADLEDTEWNSRAVGRIMIEHLIASGKARQAAARMSEVCGKAVSEWMWAIGEFERSCLCTLIAEFLPTFDPQLEPECYETVLQAALYNDVDLFKRLVQQWSPNLYRTGFVTGMTLKRIQDIVSNQSESNQNEEIRLYHALAHLYLHERKFDSALKIYISLKDPQIFAVIDKYQLFEHVKDQVSELMRINTNRALRLLLDNEDNVPASLVMSKIAGQPKLQLVYLSKLLSKNEGAEFADQAVRLYAEYDRKKLIPFLRKNENYHIRKALELCRQKNFVEEMILLFGKSGSHVDALDLMIRKCNQLDKAIEYCKEHDDIDLWSRLIDEVIQTPAHVAHLLNHAGSSIDPLRVIEKIPSAMSIPGLRNALVKLLRDYAARVELQRGCQEATRGDVRDLLTLHLQIQALSVTVTSEARCSICGRSLFLSSDTRGTDLRIFGCGHVAHSSCCLEAGPKMLLEPGTCPACSEATSDVTLS
ncbi:hypothetical protein NECAME_16201 [Necator americanus]|uniref:RING-type domain-containing protein n=1 Tax=Necator americanus TaxID=51031 RepID=W2TX59_NECAM|nr:hypothetical protein NECAME_16201 [Necator americanus]ETN86670.1 hypothetical protein NECAME_16201 [Necator americanus]